MAWNYHIRIKMAPRVYLNLSKDGVHFYRAKGSKSDTRKEWHLLE